MGITSSGEVSLNDLHVEAGGTSGTTCSFNDTDIRDILEVSSGASHNLGQYYGKKAPWTYSFTIGNLRGSQYVDQYTTNYFNQRGFSYGGGNYYPNSSQTGYKSAPTTAEQNSDYFGGKPLINVGAGFSQEGYSSGKLRILVSGTSLASSGQAANNDASFKSVQCDTDSNFIFNRSSATYTTISGTNTATYTIGSTTYYYFGSARWEWTQSSNGTVPSVPNSTNAYVWDNTPGGSGSVKFRGN
tara:strand:- start:1909 stop:2637 length:729 start_codon:yes stop_codon:yes gene_type:complete